MIDAAIKNYGEFFDYEILPEHKRVQWVSVNTKSEFENILINHKAKKIVVDFKILESPDDSSYLFALARIGLVTVYSLSNGLFAIDQFVNSKANPYYICESLSDFKLITKYLLVFRPEVDERFEVHCYIHEHTGIKDFFEREKDHLTLVEEMSDSKYKLFLADDGKCVYISYTVMKEFRKNDLGGMVEKALKPYLGNKFDHEEIAYWSLVIYQSMEQFKMHNVE